MKTARVLFEICWPKFYDGYKTEVAVAESSVFLWLQPPASSLQPHATQGVA